MTTNKSTLHLSPVNFLTRELRKGIQETAVESKATTRANVKLNAKVVASTLSRLKLDDKTDALVGGDEATHKSAAQWGERIARPWELGVKYGSRVAKHWDYAFSFLVGRGLKNDEAPVDVGSLAKAGAPRWQAVRQEGVLGLLTRASATGLGNLVGLCFKDKSRATTVKNFIDNGAVGFNALVRLTTLSTTSAVAAGVGVLVGAGVSGLVGLVAVPALWHIKDAATLAAAKEKADAKAKNAGDSKSAKKAAAAEKAAQKAKAKAASAKPSDGAKDAENPTSAQLHERFELALDKLNLHMEKQVAKREGVLLKNLVAANKAHADLKLEGADQAQISAASRKRRAAAEALESYQQGAPTARAESKRLAEVLKKVEARADASGNDVASLEAVLEARGHLEAHNKTYDVGPLMSPTINTKSYNNLVEGLSKYQKAARAESRAAAVEELNIEGRMFGSRAVPQGYQDTVKRVQKLHDDGVIVLDAMPLAAEWGIVESEAREEAPEHLKDAQHTLAAIDAKSVGGIASEMNVALRAMDAGTDPALVKKYAGFFGNLEQVSDQFKAQLGEAGDSLSVVVENLSDLLSLADLSGKSAPDQVVKWTIDYRAAAGQLKNLREQVAEFDKGIAKFDAFEDTVKGSAPKKANDAESASDASSDIDADNRSDAGSISDDEDEFFDAPEPRDNNA